MRKAAEKLIFIILTYTITFINKAHGDIKRRCKYLKQGPSPE